MTTSQRSFALGVLTALPILPIAWILGGRNGDGPPPKDHFCACASQIERVDGVAQALSAALSRIEKIAAAGTDVPRVTGAREEPAVRRESEVDISAQVTDAVRRCFASFWTFSFDDTDGLRAALLSAGKTPFDEGVMERALEIRRRLSEEDQRFANDAAAIKSKYPLVARYFQAAEDGSSIPASKEDQRAYMDEFNSYVNENNPRAAQHEKARKAILQEFKDALSSK